MKLFRKISFGVLMACVLGLVMADTLRAPEPWGRLLFLVGTISVFALFVWVFAFLKEEPTLTRIALVVLALCMAALCYLISTGGDSN
jgi:peptidoglycan/LPS O-acetylase OafA/YrhL